MKKFKILLPIASVLATTSMVAPILSSCGCSKEQYKNVIPTDLLDIDGSTLKGFKEDADISKYDTLEIPSNVRIIGKQAFGVQSNKNIRRIVFNSGIKEIQTLSFAGLEGLLEIDLSRLTINDCYQLKVGGSIFGISNDYRYVHIKMNSSWSAEAKKRVQSLFINAGVPYEWFIQPTEGHINFNGKKENTTKGDDVITSQATISDFYAVNGNFTVILERTGGSDGVLVNLDDYELTENTANETSQTLTFKSSLDVEDGHTLTDGEYVTYRAVIYGKYMAETKWIQIIDGFKLTYVKNGDINPTKVEFDLETKDCFPGETFSLDYTVYPKLATNKAVTWKSSNSEVISVNEKTGQCKALKEGSATITATTVNGLSASCIVTSKVDIEGLGFSNYGSVYYCFDGGFKKEKLVIPSTYNGCPVIGIDDEGFEGNEYIKEVVIPKSVYQVFSYAFNNCTNLTKVTFADESTINSIANYAFKDCSSLSTINFGKDTKIGTICANSFQNCTDLKTITLPKVYELVPSAFNGSGLSYKTENNIKYLVANGKDHYAAVELDIDLEVSTKYTLEFNSECEIICTNFIYNNYIPGNIEITLQDFNKSNIKSIGSYAFTNYQAEPKPNETSRRPGPFYQIQNTQLIIPNSVYYIGEDAFGCFVSDSVESFGKHKFTKLTLNEGLEWIGSGAFANLLISELSIPASVEWIGSSYYYDYSFIAVFGEIETRYYNQTDGAFAHNLLTKVEFAKNSQLEWIGAETFAWTNNKTPITYDLSELNKLWYIGDSVFCVYPSEYTPAVDEDGDDENHVTNELNAEQPILTIKLPDSISHLGNIFGIYYSVVTGSEYVDVGGWGYLKPIEEQHYFIESYHKINLDMGNAAKSAWYFNGDSTGQPIYPNADLNKFIEQLTYCFNYYFVKEFK